MIRRILIFLSLAVAPLAAQIPSGYVQTTATVASLANGTFGAVWTNLSTSPQLALLGCVSVFQQTVNGNFDSNGHFSVLLADTAQICPSPSTWTFTLTFACPATVPPAGAFTVQVAVTGGGGTEDISSQITAALPTNPCGGGSGGTVQYPSPAVGAIPVVSATLPTTKLANSGITQTGSGTSQVDTFPGTVAAGTIGSEVQAANFTGADWGAKITNALGSFGAGNCGTVVIPNGVLTYSTTIQLPVAGNSLNCILRGQGDAQPVGTGSPTETSTILAYTGTGVALDQTVTNSTYANQTGAKVQDLVIECSGCGAGSVGIKAGGTHALSFEHVSVLNFSGAGDKGIWLYNSASTEYTEQVFESDLHLSNNTIGLDFDGTGAISFDHAIMDSIWCDTFAGQTCIAETNGASLWGGDLSVNGNIQGLGAIGFSVDATSTTSYNMQLKWLAEATSGSPTRFSVASGGVFTPVCLICMGFGYGPDVGVANQSGIDLLGGTAFKLPGISDNYIATLEHTNFTMNHVFRLPDCGFSTCIFGTVDGTGASNLLPKYLFGSNGFMFTNSQLADDGTTISLGQTAAYQITINTSTGAVKSGGSLAIDFSSSLFYVPTSVKSGSSAGPSITFPSFASTLPGTVANGTASMTTAAITAGTCGPTVTVAATGVVPTDTIKWSFNAAPNGTQAGLVAWPTAGYVNFAYCGIAETPAAMTINWSVTR